MKWTNEQTEYLKQNALILGIPYCAKYIGKTYAAANYKARTLGLTRRPIPTHPDNKICSKCQEEKPKAEFHSNGRPNELRTTCRSCDAIWKRTYNATHRDEVKTAKRRYFIATRTTRNQHRRQYVRIKRQNDIHFKIKGNLRTRIWKALKGYHKSATTVSLLGCSIPDLKTYLAAQFQAKMTWENYGDWHIDHIKPCASFDLTEPAQQQECFHYTNLQPLWATENISKGAKMAF